MIPDLYLLWDDGVLTVAPVPMWLRKHLSYEEKSLEQDPKGWGKVVRRRQKPLYTDLSNGAVQTYQGLWHHVKTEAEARGHKVHLVDRREPFPEPRLDLMGGFRFNQRQLVMETLGKQCSGLLGAPTRYGKSWLMTNILKAFPDLPTVVVAPGVDLVKQLYAEIQERVGGREIKLICTGSRVKYQSETGITVCSIDSLHKCEPTLTKFMLIDEPHETPTDSRAPMIHMFTRARKIGFGATLSQRFDNRGLLIQGLMGPVLANRTYREAVDEGAVAPMRVFLLKVEGSQAGGYNREHAYRHGLYLNDRRARLIAAICKEVLPPEWQTLLFIQNEEQAEFYKRYIGDEGTIAMAKRMKKAEREELKRQMADDEVKRCLASVIYSTGVTFNHVRAVFNLCGGGPYARNVQKPGRVAEVRPGKKCGVMFDFLFEGDGPLAGDSGRRRDLYLETGYDVTEVATLGELKEKFAEYCI